jgi:hypothetical protein
MEEVGEITEETTKILYPDENAAREWKPVNQLKYVCRQLRQETTGLELKFNLICSTTPDAQRADTGFLNFLRTRSRLELGLIRKVIVDDKTPRFSRRRVMRFSNSNPRAFACRAAQAVRTGQDFVTSSNCSLYDFCELYPSAQVIVRLELSYLDATPKRERVTTPHVFSSLINYMVHIALMQLIFPSSGRKLTKLCHTEQHLFDIDVSYISQNALIFASARRQLDNLRYSLSPFIDEDDFRYVLSTEPEEYSREQIEERVEWLKELYENGV